MKLNLSELAVVSFTQLTFQSPTPLQLALYPMLKVTDQGPIGGNTREANASAMSTGVSPLNYAHPLTGDAIREFKNFNAGRPVNLPLTPLGKALFLGEQNGEGDQALSDLLVKPDFVRVQRLGLIAASDFVSAFTPIP